MVGNSSFDMIASSSNSTKTEVFLEGFPEAVFRSVLEKRCTENMQQIYRRTPMPKSDFIKLLCNFIEITLRHECSPVTLLHISRTPSKNTPGGLLLDFFSKCEQIRSFLWICSRLHKKSSMENFFLCSIIVLIPLKIAIQFSVNFACIP